MFIIIIITLYNIIIIIITLYNIYNSRKYIPTIIIALALVPHLSRRYRALTFACN